MAFFIDFEATQFSEKIISVGCVNEYGFSYYSLVYSGKEQITPFITNLTGITQEMYSNAPTVTEVFSELYDKIFSDKKDSDYTPIFYTWGNADLKFLRNSFFEARTKKSCMMIGYLLGSIQDYSNLFCKHYKIAPLKLIKVYNLLIDKNKIQVHNALDDAVMLKNIYQYCGSNRNLNTQLQDFKQLSERQTTSQKYTKLGLPVGTICIINEKKELLHSFSNMDDRAEWVKTFFGMPDYTKIKNVKRQIKKAITQGIRYNDCIWRII